MFDVLQIGRALAALAVCAFHMSVVFGDSRFGGAPVLGSFTSQGYLGVDFFFALSGFIICFAHKGDVGNPSRLIPYALKRFIRIYPLYWLVSAFVLLGAFFIGGVNRPPGNAADAFTVVSLIRLTDIDPPVHAAWTLFHEVMFYTFFAVVIWRSRVGVALFCCWVIVVFADPIAGGKLDSHVLSKLATEPVNILFFAGIVSFFLYKKLTKAGAFFSFGIGVILLAAWLVNDWDHGSQVVAKSCLAACFTLILSGAVAMESLGVTFKWPTLKLIGDASFTLYLTHESVQSLSLKVLSKFAPGIFARPVLSYVIVFVICVGFAVLMYLQIERRLLRVVKNLLLYNPNSLKENPKHLFPIKRQ